MYERTYLKYLRIQRYIRSQLVFSICQLLIIVSIKHY